MKRPATSPECLDCKYPLGGLSVAQCPECSRPFNPNDRSTFGPRRQKWTWRIAKSAPPTWLIMLVAAIAAFALPFVSAPITTKGFAAFILLCVLLPIFLFIPFWAWFLVMLISRQKLAITEEHLPLLNKRWRGVGLVMLLFLVIQHSGAVFWTRWWLARPAFERLRDTNDSQSPRWVGTFHVRSITPDYAKHKTVCFEVRTLCESYVYVYYGYTKDQWMWMDESKLDLGGGWHAGWYSD